MSPLPAATKSDGNVKKNCGKAGVEWYQKLLHARRESEFDRIWDKVPAPVKAYIEKTPLGEQFPVKAPVSTRGKTASSGIEGMDQRPSFHEKAEHGMLQTFS